MPMRIMRILENFKINISNAVFKTTEGTEVYTCWQGIPHANNSFGKCIHIYIYLFA